MNILNVEELSENEMKSTEGGFVATFLAIGAAAAAGVAIYEAGRYTGAFIKNHIIN